MNLPGLLIEYLINGCIAIIWIIKIVDVQSFPAMVNELNLLLVPIIYVLGMFVDYVAWVVTKPVKRIIRRRALDEVAEAITIKDKAFAKKVVKDGLALTKRADKLEKEVLKIVHKGI